MPPASVPPPGMRPPGPRPIVHVEQVMGTVVSFHVHPADASPASSASAQRAIAAAVAVLHEADHIFSTYKPESPISRMRRGELDLAQAPSLVHEVVSACMAARRATAGWFDPWAMPGGFDPTGLVKGWAARRAMEALRHGGIVAGMVNAGGDIVVIGEPRPAPCWRIAIVDPHRAGHLLGSVALPVSDRPSAIATSGRNERGDHLLNPYIGAPAEGDVAAATVTGPDLAMADALATALAVAPSSESATWTIPGYDWLLVHNDGTRSGALLEALDPGVGALA